MKTTRLLFLLLLAPTLLRAQSMQSADSAWKRGDTETAERQYSVILKGDSSNVVALHRYALTQAWKNRFPEALRLFDKIVAINPENFDARVDRARVLAWKGDTHGAVAALDSVLAQDPKNAAALQVRAQAESWMGSYDEALQTYQRLRAITPNDASVRYEEARVLTWANRYGAATAAYDSLLRANPNDVPAMQGLARMTAWSGDLVKAEALWRRALQLEPKNTATLTGLATTLRWQGRDAAALEYLNTALSIAPTDKDAKEQLRWVNAAMAAKAALSFIREQDSDDNGINSTRLVGSKRVASRTELRADVYRRGATAPSGPVATISHSAGGAAIGLWHQVEPGWALSAMGGLSVSSIDYSQDNKSAPSFGIVRAAIATPTRGSWNGSASYAYGALDATSLLILNEVTTSDFAVAANYSSARLFNLNLGASTTGFHSRVSGQDNRRTAESIALTRRIAKPLTLGIAARTFGFSKDLTDGYFDPDFYGSAELLGRYRYENNRIGFNAEVAPGYQKIGKHGDTSPSYRVSSRLTYMLGMGRTIEAFGTFANSGLNQLSELGRSGYRYGAFGVSANWTF